MEKGKTLVVMLQQGIGDTLMGIPLLRNCDAKLGPSDTMIVLVKSVLEMSVINSVSWSGNVKVLTSEREGGIKKYFRLAKTALQLRKMQPTVLLAPLLFPRLMNTLWIRLVNAKLSVGPPDSWNRYAFDKTIKREPGVHYVEYFIRCGDAAGFSGKHAPDLKIPITTKMQAQARSMMPGWGAEQRWVAIGPGSGGNETYKRWPVSHFRELAGLLLQYSSSIRIAFFGSLEERGLLKSILNGADFDSSRCFCFTGEQFGVALSLISQCHCMVAGCAGPIHMAAAVGIPVVGIYGPSNPGFEGPYSERHYTARVDLECSPCCGEGPNIGCDNPVCMSLIKPKTVYEGVINALNGFPPPPVPWIPVARGKKHALH